MPFYSFVSCYALLFSIFLWFVVMTNFEMAPKQVVYVTGPPDPFERDVIVNLFRTQIRSLEDKLAEVLNGQDVQTISSSSSSLYG